MAFPLPAPVERRSVFPSWTNWVRHVVDSELPLVRNHQRESIQRTVNHFTTSMFGQLILPTGCGKTGVAILLPYYMGVSRVLVLAPHPDLASQLNDAFCGPHCLPRDPVPSRQDDAFVFKIELDLADGRDVSYQDNEANRNTLLPARAYPNDPQEMGNFLRGDLLVINHKKIQPHTSLKQSDLPLDYDLLIVDEAHHYPVETWRAIMQHYRGPISRTKILFLTATPNTDHIAPVVPTIWNYSFRTAVNDRAIRDIEFTELQGPQERVLQDLVAQLKAMVGRFDTVDCRYQAMIEVRGRDVELVLDLYNQGMDDGNPEVAKACIQGSPRDLVDDFKRGTFRTMVVIHKLMEGFDNPNVAFVIVARAMGMRTFNQFVGRATRIGDGSVPVAQVLSHATFAQQKNFNAMHDGGD